MIRFVLVLSVVLSAALPAADWPHYLGPDQRSSTSPEQRGPWRGADIAWRAEVGTGLSAISVAHQTAFAAGHQAGKTVLLALDAASGEERWRFAYDQVLDAERHLGGPHATPTIADDLVYMQARSGHVYALDRRSGVVVWQRDMVTEERIKRPTYGFSGSPTIIGRFLLVNAGENGFCLDRRNGETMWHSIRKVPASSSTLIATELAQREMIFCLRGDGLVQVDAGAGSPKWVLPWKTKYQANLSSPVVTDSGIFIGSGYGTGVGMVQFSVEGDPKLAWTNAEIQQQWCTPVYHDGHIYTINASAVDDSKPGRLTCLIAKTGAVAWEQDGFGLGDLIRVGDKLLVLSETGILVQVALDATAYREEGRQQLLDGRCWTKPSFADGRFYARSDKGKVVCATLK